jgi:hypothetical protein
MAGAKWGDEGAERHAPDDSAHSSVAVGGVLKRSGAEYADGGSFESAGGGPGQAGGIAYDRIQRVTLLRGDRPSPAFAGGAEAVSERGCLGICGRGGCAQESGEGGEKDGLGKPVGRNGDVLDGHGVLSARSLSHPLSVVFDSLPGDGKSERRHVGLDLSTDHFSRRDLELIFEDGTRCSHSTSVEVRGLLVQGPDASNRARRQEVARDKPR